MKTMEARILLLSDDYSTLFVNLCNNLVYQHQENQVHAI